MFAVVDISGFQEIVEKGQKIRVPSQKGKVGDMLTFEKVLLVSGQDDAVTVGAPHIAHAFVKAKIVGHGRGDKIRVLRFKRRKRFLKLRGHRQGYTEIEVMDVGAGK